MLRTCAGLAFLCLVSLLVTSSAAAETYVVTQSGFSFSPTPLVILEGDTVEWHWTGGAHTVTNGTGDSDPNAGVLFDEDLNSSFPVVSYTFPSVGTYDYFCRPHEGFNMKGQILVDAPTPSEPATWGRLKKLFEEPAGN